MNLQEFQKGNIEAQRLNAERQRLQGAIEENKRIFADMCKKFKDTYGVDVTPENLTDLCNAEVEVVNGKMQEQAQLIEYIKSGAYRAEYDAKLKAEQEALEAEAKARAEALEKAKQEAAQVQVQTNVTTENAFNGGVVQGNFVSGGVASADLARAKVDVTDYLTDGNMPTPSAVPAGWGTPVATDAVVNTGAVFGGGIGATVAKTPNFGDDIPATDGGIVKAVENMSGFGETVRKPNFGDDEPNKVDIPSAEVVKPADVGLPANWGTQAGTVPVQNASPFASIIQNKFGGNN